MSPASESERLEEEEPLRLTLGPAPRWSLRLNLLPSTLMEAGLLRRAGGAGKKAGGELGPGMGVLGLSLALERKPETPAEMLGALLAGRLGGRLGQSECVGEEEEEEEEEEGGAAAPWSMVGWDKRRQNRVAYIYI